MSLAGCQQVPAPQATATAITVHEYKNPAAFNLLYPAGWEYLVIQQGLLIFGEARTVGQQEAGASVSFFRRDADEIRGGLEGTFQHYLDNGPLSDEFVATTEIKPTELGGRPALAVSVESAADRQPAMRAYIMAAHTESGPIYIISAAAPSLEWDANWPLFQILFNSLEFNE